MSDPAFRGEAAGSPLELIVHDWNAEIWTGGAFTAYRKPPVPGSAWAIQAGQDAAAADLKRLQRPARKG